MLTVQQSQLREEEREAACAGSFLVVLVLCMRIVGVVSLARSSAGAGFAGTAAARARRVPSAGAFARRAPSTGRKHSRTRALQAGRRRERRDVADRAVAHRAAAAQPPYAALAHWLVQARLQHHVHFDRVAHRTEALGFGRVQNGKRARLETHGEPVLQSNHAKLVPRVPRMQTNQREQGTLSAAIDLPMALPCSSSLPICASCPPCFRLSSSALSSPTRVWLAASCVLSSSSSLADASSWPINVWVS